MAANEIACSINALNADIRQIDSAYSSVVKSKDSVMSSVTALNGMWKGSAHDKFESSFSRDYENINTLCETIKNIIECLNFAKSEYSKCEQEVNREIASINI